MGDATDGFTREQLQAVALIPKIPSFLSLVAQMWIVAEVSYSKKKRGSVYHRMLAGLSVASMFRSVAFFFSTWPIPRDFEGAFGNIGNRTTCRIQGFIIQFGLVSPIYMAMISMYYWLTIRYGWPEKRMRTKEIWVHALPWVLGIATAITGLLLDLYHPAGFYCWIAPNGLNNNRSDLYRLGLYYGPLWFCFGLVLLFFGSLYWSIRAEEIRTLRYRQPHLFQASSEIDSSGDEDEDDNKAPTRMSMASRLSHLSVTLRRQSARSSREQIWRDNRETRMLSLQVASQVLWYVVAFCAAHYSGTLYRLLEFFDIRSFAMMVVMAILDPLQGFFDFCVYRRPIYLRLRRKEPEKGVLSAIGKTLRWPGIEGQKPKRPKLVDFSPPQFEDGVGFSKETLNDPLGALEDDEIDEGVENPQEDNRLHELRKERIQKMKAEAKMESSDRRLSGRTSVSTRKSSMPKIVEDLELQLSEEFGASRVQHEVEVCLDRDRQLEILADLDIIEEVKEWVSNDVKRHVRRQMSLPCMRRNNLNLPASSMRKPAGVSEEKDGIDEDGDVVPAPPLLTCCQTV
jgi:hypothetical protein